MRKLEKKEANISEIYNLEGIVGGDIIANNKKVSIFEIGELCLLEKDKDVEQVIKNAYMSCIRAIPGDYQILVKTSKIDMEEYIEDIGKKQTNLLSNELKNASKSYIAYMKNIWKSKQIYITKYYFISSNLSKQEEENVESAFNNMGELGIKINKIEDDNKIYNIINSCIG